MNLLGLFMNCTFALIRWIALFLFVGAICASSWGVLYVSIALIIITGIAFAILRALYPKEVVNG